MFNQRTISSKFTVDFWNSLSLETSEKRLKGQLFKFNKAKDETLITIVNEKMLLNPKIDFIQARIQKSTKGEDLIIVETKKFIKILYQGIIIFVSVFAALNFTNNIIALIFITFVLILIVRYNYNQINKAIQEFEIIMENYSQQLY